MSLPITRRFWLWNQLIWRPSRCQAAERTTSRSERASPGERTCRREEPYVVVLPLNHSNEVGNRCRRSRDRDTDRCSSCERFQTYIFEVVEVVPDPNRPQRKYRLKLLCQDDSKGAVTALANINGYLISSMAQKVRLTIQHSPRSQGRV